MTLLDILRYRSRLSGDYPAIRSEEGQMTFQQFEEACQSLCRSLFGLGLRKGDRVAVLDFNSIEGCLVSFGVPAFGMVAVPLNFRLADKEMIEVLNDSGASALIYSPAFAEMVNRIRSELPAVKHFIGTRPGGQDPHLQTLMESPPKISFLEPTPDDLAHLLYTSGTTGRPKGVQLTHRNSLTTITSLLIDFRLEPEDIGLMVAPLFHVAGFHTFMALFARGCSVHLLPAFDPIKTVEALRTTKASVTLLVPAMIAALMNLPEQHPWDPASLRLVIYAGAPMPEELLKACLDRFGYRFLQIYGTTETSAITCLTPEDHQTRSYVASAGRQLFGSDLRVVDDLGHEVAPGEIGEVVVRGEGMMPGYWNSPQETERVIRDGWFHTGDVGLSDDHGYLFLKDRKKDMIVTGGENVYPVEVENVLLQDSAILEAAVIGTPDKKWGEQVLAIVRLKAGPPRTAEEIISFCRERLAGYKCPKAVTFSKDPLPRTPSGKIRKNILRQPFWEGLERKIH